MIEALKIAVRARQRIVEELCRLADIHTDRLGALANAWAWHEIPISGFQASLRACG